MAILDPARDMGAVYSIMDIGHSSIVSRVGVISNRQVEQFKGHDGRFIKSISDLPATVNISQNPRVIQRREQSFILYPVLDKIGKKFAAV